MGSGHDEVARELTRRLAALGIPSSVIDILHCVPAALGQLIRTGYYSTATFAPWLLDLSWRSTQSDSSGSSRLLTAASRTRLLRLIGGSRVVVSVHPFATQALGAMKASGGYAGQTVSYLTDPAPHDMWIHRDIDHHLTVTESTARAASARYGVSVRCAGPLAAARFRAQADPGQRERLRKELGVPDDAVLALLASGANGLGQAARSARAVRAAGFRPVVICGRNAGLRRQLTRAGIQALGWRDDVQQLMAAADIMVHNAGGLTLTEAMVAGLPAVSFLPIAGHGVANARFLERHGMAPWARTVADLQYYGRLLATARRRPLPASTETAAQFIAGLRG
jgi:processive 1,2-diacylglycerol beta-glucosyltransferase